MNETKTDQAKLLRAAMDEINQSEETLEDVSTTDKETAPEIDIFELPPRSEIHAEMESRFKYKISGGFIRFFIVLIIIIVILVLTYNYWGDYFFS